MCMEMLRVPKACPLLLPMPAKRENETGNQGFGARSPFLPYKRKGRRRKKRRWVAAWPKQPLFATAEWVWLCLWH